LIQAVEVLEFDYRLQSKATAKVALLRVRSVQDMSSYAFPKDSFCLQSFPYRINLTITNPDRATYFLEQGEEGHVDLCVKWQGEAGLLVGVWITDEETSDPDGITHVLTFPFDLEVL